MAFVGSANEDWIKAVADGQFFDLPGQDRDQGNFGPTGWCWSHPGTRRRHSHDVDADVKTADSRSQATRRLCRQHSESTRGLLGTPSGGVRASNTWSGQHHQRLYDDDHGDENENDSESDGEGWC